MNAIKVRVVMCDSCLELLFSKVKPLYVQRPPLEPENSDHGRQMVVV